MQRYSFSLFMAFCSSALIQLASESIVVSLEVRNSNRTIVNAMWGMCAYFIMPTALIERP